MQILRVINNNVISSLDDEKREVVVMGKGVGFQKKAGDLVDASRIEKIFQLPKEHTNQYERLVSDMPYEHIKMAEEIIQYAARTLKRHLNKKHLHYADRSSGLCDRAPETGNGFPECIALGDPEIL